MQHVDMNSPEFKAELEKTWKFVKKVNQRFGFVQHPQDDVNEGVALGLARNKILYGKRYCPCFMVLEILQRREKRLIIEYVHVNQP